MPVLDWIPSPSRDGEGLRGTQSSMTRTRIVAVAVPPRPSLIV
jgi:hypothetical protein